MIIGGIAALITISGIFFLAYLDHYSFEKTMVFQTQQQLLMIAKTTATRLEEYIVEHFESLKTISKNPLCQEDIYKKIIQDKSSSGFCPIKNLHEIHKDDTDALTTLDANGIMLHRHPFIANKPGMDHTDKPGVAYVLKHRKPHISEAFYNNLGNPAISISAPVFYKDEFAGIVRWMIQLDTIYKRFVQPMEVNENSCSWILDDSGTVMAHHNSEELCKDFMAVKKERFPGHDWSALENMIEKARRGKEDAGSFDCPKRGKRLAAYAPVYAGNRLWSVGISIGYSEISGPINQHAVKTLGLASITLLLFAIISGAYYKTQKKKTALEIETKYLGRIAKSAEALQKVCTELENKNKETSKLSKKLLYLQERDRQQLSMELHDQIGQTLTIIKMDLEMASNSILSLSPESRNKLAEIGNALVQAIREVKNICHRLRPSALDNIGLLPSLTILIEEIEERGGIEVEFYTKDIPQRFNPDIEIAIYRIVQEALTNIVKYADAKQIFINLILRGSIISLGIEDDGIGFDIDDVLKKARTTGNGLGLLIMRERVDQLKGDFSIVSSSGQGTHILVEIPL